MNGSVSVSISHNFETAHRLPFLGGKCTNWHGHSWNVDVSIENVAFDEGIDGNGISIEFGLVKAAILGWIDNTLDHGTMIGFKDPMFDAFERDGGKLFVFGDYGDYKALPWPTVEAVTCMLAEKLQEVVYSIGTMYRVRYISVMEKADNSAQWMPAVEK
jgi:6-pyruvoyltetrahydropterin/6-carboxytetrahydropterin synthase